MQKALNMQEVLKEIKPTKEEQVKFKQSSDSFLKKIKIELIRS